MAPKNANFSYATPIFSAEDLAATKIVYVVGLGSRLFFEHPEPWMPVGAMPASLPNFLQNALETAGFVL